MRQHCLKKSVALPDCSSCGVLLLTTGSGEILVTLLWDVIVSVHHFNIVYFGCMMEDRGAEPQNKYRT